MSGANHVRTNAIIEGACGLGEEGDADDAILGGFYA